MPAYAQVIADDPRLAALAVAFFIVAILAFVAALALGIALGRRSGRLEAERDGRGLERSAREDAVKRSRAVLTGQIGEQLAPYLPGFPCDPADARFIGKPIDFVAFPSAAAGRPAEVLFIEVKSGESRLSGSERALKEAIMAGRVRWIEYRAPL